MANQYHTVTARSPAAIFDVLTEMLSWLVAARWLWRHCRVVCYGPGSWRIHSKRSENAECLLGHAHLMLPVNVNRKIWTTGYLQHSSCTSVKPTKFCGCQRDLSSSTLQETAFMHAGMDHTQLSTRAEDRAPLLIPESLIRRQRLHAIAAGGEDLYEPPNTAEAFARLEAAIDEVKFHGSMSEGQGLIARRQRLREIVGTYQDLYEPPDTAEAFARLEAAIDEVKRHALASGNDSGEDQMLDPPTTVERFNRIETAIDEVLVGHTIDIETPRRVQKSTSDPYLSTKGAGTEQTKTVHLLRKRQSRFATQRESTKSNHSTDESTKTSEFPGLKRKPHGYFSRRGSLRLRSEIYKPSNSYEPTPGEVDLTNHGAVDLPISEIEGSETVHDVDVFRDDDSVKAFANQTYQSVKEKYS